MIKKFFCKLFGLCYHEWGNWEFRDYIKSNYVRQYSECKKCGKIESRIV